MSGDHDDSVASQDRAGDAGDQSVFAYAPTRPVSAARVAALGDPVEAEGWVTAAYPTGGLNGFVIQTAGTGGACLLDSESEAIFVYTGASAPVFPAVGDYVVVEGVRAAYSGLAQISNPSVTITADVAGIEPVEVTSCAWPGTHGERMALQSMLYQPADESLVVTNNYDANQYGSLTISTTGKPLQQPTDVAPLGSSLHDEVKALNDASKFVLDDGATTRFAGASGANSANALLTPPYVFDDGRTAVGAEVTILDPLIVDYRNNAWTLNPTAPIATSASGVIGDLPASFSYSRPTAPTDASLGNPDVVVGGFNLENYFPTHLAADWPLGCTSYNDNAGNPITANRCTGEGPRGAWDQESLDRQTAKLVSAIEQLDASALGIMELENSYKLSSGDPEQAGASASYLVEALNDSAGFEKWDYIEPDIDAAEDISQQDVMYPGIIYQPGDVTPVGDNLVLSDQSGPGQPFSNARAPFGQAFEPVDGGDPFLLVANHFKSKSCSDGAVDAGQGCFNEDRVAQAQALAEWIEDTALPALTSELGEPVEDVVLVGDFNAYTFEDPMIALYDSGYENVNVVDGAPAQASYNYSGLNGSLDHVLVSSSAAEKMTGHAIWEINGPESIAYNYSRYNASGGAFFQSQAGQPWRSSDHSPAVVGLALEASKNLTTLQLLNINDFHGRVDGTLSPSGSSPRVLTASPTMEFVGTIELLKQQYQDGTLFLSAGDNVGASLFASAIQKDLPTIELLNTLGLAATAIGNHEFDTGWPNFQTEIDALFNAPHLAANVYDSSGNVPAPLQSYKMFEDVDGYRVAVIGAVTQEAPTLVNPSTIAGLTFGDPVDAVNRVAGELEALPESERPDVIVAEYHEGAGEGEGSSTLQNEMAASETFRRIVEDTSSSVDVIFTGHTHKEYAWAAPAQIPGSDQSRPVVQTGSYGGNIAQVLLQMDADGDVVSWEAENVSTKAEALEFCGVLDADCVQDLRNINEATGEAYDIILSAMEVAETEGNVVTGKISQTISRAYTEGEYVDGKFQKTSGSAEDRGDASPLGTLIGNMLLRSATLSSLPDSPDLGVTNPGGIRTDFVYDPQTDGAITVAMARSVLPFNNDLSIVKLTGAQIVKMLEQQWQRDAAGNVPSRPHLTLGLSDNVQYTYHEIDDPNIEGATLGVIDSVLIDGVPLDMQRVYNVGTFSFLAAGGDNFHVFQEADQVINTGFLDWEAWLEYLSTASENGPIVPDFARQGVAVEGLPSEPVEPGASISLTYGQMNLHAVGAPANTEVSVTATAEPASGTRALASPTASATVATEWDAAAERWVDSALVQVVVPSDSAGTVMITADVAPTGTQATSVLAVKATSDGGGTDAGRKPGGSLAATGVGVVLVLMAAALATGTGAAVRRSSRAR